MAGMAATKRAIGATYDAATSAPGTPPGTTPEVGTTQEATAFIGGGCCVHLSVEYAPNTPTAVSKVAVIVQDVDGTHMAWEKTEQPGAGYQVKEGVISTRPGSKVTLAVSNMTARIRWCEIFSC
jgi:hypothetical protein